MSSLRGARKFQYDLLVLGGGSGGVRCARISAAHGAKVGLVENALEHGPPHYSAMGGTCVNVGCVPKKLMVIGSSHAVEERDARGFGWSKGGESTHDWSAFMAAKNKEISRLNGIYSGMLGKVGVEITAGHGVLSDAHTVRVTSAAGDSIDLTAERILVCVGGWPFRPDIPGIEHAITSNEIFYLKERPENFLVIGGGYIAVEFACIMSNFGSSTTLMYRSDLFLRGFDDDVRTHLRDELEASSVALEFNTNVTSIVKQSDNKLLVTDTHGKSRVFDAVLVATGRVPKTSGIGLEEAGVKLGKGGSVVVDKFSCTNISNIYAVGDVTDKVQLTPVALREGHVLADNLFGNLNVKKHVNYEFIPSAVFSQPEIGTCGYTESDAVAKFKDVKVFISTFRPLPNTISGSTSKTMMKLVVESVSDKVVGLHMVGPHAGEITQGFAVAMLAGATKENFDVTIGIHPTSAEEFVTMRTTSREYKNGAKL